MRIAQEPLLDTSIPALLVTNPYNLLFASRPWHTAVHQNLSPSAFHDTVTVSGCSSFVVLHWKLGHMMVSDISFNRAEKVLGHIIRLQGKKKQEDGDFKSSPLISEVLVLCRNVWAKFTSVLRASRMYHRAGLEHKNHFSFLPSPSDNITQRKPFVAKTKDFPSFPTGVWAIVLRNSWQTLTGTNQHEGTMLLNLWFADLT